MINTLQLRHRGLAELFQMPGREWTEDERNEVKTWLYEPKQLELLLYTAMRYLGPGAVREDAEDACQEFAVYQLDKVIMAYNPAIVGANFWGFVRSACFKNYCKSWRRKLRKKMAIEEPMESDVDGDGEWDSWLDKITAEGLAAFHRGDPSGRSPFTELSEKEVREVIAKGFSKLAPHYSEVLSMSLFKEMGVNEIAEALNEPVGTIKSRLHRARKTLAHYLVKKGINK